MNPYLAAIKINICSICVDSNENGRCRLNEKETCAVELYLPLIVEIVHTAETDDIHEIHKMIKEKICTNCKAQDNDGNCYLREDANCSLDRYYSLIIETIKKVDSNN